MSEYVCLYAFKAVVVAAMRKSKHINIALLRCFLQQKTDILMVYITIIDVNAT